MGPIFANLCVRASEITIWLIEKESACSLQLYHSSPLFCTSIILFILFPTLSKVVLTASAVRHNKDRAGRGHKLGRC